MEDWKTKDRRPEGESGECAGKVEEPSRLLGRWVVGDKNRDGSSVVGGARGSGCQRVALLNDAGLSALNDFVIACNLGRCPRLV